MTRIRLPRRPLIDAPCAGPGGDRGARRNHDRRHGRAQNGVGPHRAPRDHDAHRNGRRRGGTTGPHDDRWMVRRPRDRARVRAARRGDVYAHGVVLSGSSPAPRPLSVSFENIGSREEGFPIQTTTIRREHRATDGAPPASRIETVVTELATVPLDPALFEIPGFRRADGFAAWIGDGLNAAWQAVKRAASSLFQPAR